MGVTIQGNKIDRYGDIWSGFFVKKVIDCMGDSVCVGDPIVIHNRNFHDLLKDLRQELGGMILTESLVTMLDSIQLTSKNYLECYRELAEKLKKIVGNNNSMDDETKNYFYQITNSMKIWSDVCETLMKNK